jgi:hypothetical protein
VLVKTVKSTGFYVPMREQRSPVRIRGASKRSEMSSKAKQYDGVHGMKTTTKGHAKAEARRRARQRYGRSQGLPWFKIAVGAVAVLLIAMLGFNFMNTGYGKLSAQSTNYSFGNVPWRGGLVTTQFPLNVEGDTMVNDIVST